MELLLEDTPENTEEALEVEIGRGWNNSEVNVRKVCIVVNIASRTIPMRAQKKIAVRIFLRDD
jgi:hypothetical protein